ncbi:MAG: hypothetical protein ACE5KX_03960 [Acidimicrobiia bacterium]
MASLHVEGWAPEYGPAIEPDESLAPAEGEVDSGVEAGGAWEPIPGDDDGVPVLAFVDGVRRIDARLTVDDAEAGPIPGLCASFGAGAVLWHRGERRSEIVETRVERLAVLAVGRSELFPAVSPELAYRTETVADADPASLVRHVHDRMRRAEAELAERLAADGYFVVADGPINELSSLPKVGYVKSHRVSYLPVERAAVIAALRPGQRTPLFTLGAYRRYSWYLRLAEVPGGHSWSGVVRCEASGSIALNEVRAVADRTAAVLPLVASEGHIDPRAPQNLVPIAALERQLRRLLGDPDLVYRALLAAVARREAVA